MKKILVTGGAGFIGSHVVDYLLSKENEVTVLDDLSGGLQENIHPSARFIKGSITNPSTVEDAIKGQEIIYHFAAYAAEGLSHNIRKFNYTNNLIGSINIINAAIKHNIEKLVFTSSIAVYGSGKNSPPPFKEDQTPFPEDPYGIAKLAVEQDLAAAHQTHNLNYVILRPYNVYGERQFLGDPYRNVLGIFMNNIMKGKPPCIFGDGKQKRAFSYIGDVAPCIAESAFIEKANGQTINLGASRTYSVNTLAQVVIDAMGVSMKPEHLPPRFEVKYAWCDNTKAKKILGYQENTSLSME